jgi:hypothetical protein
MAMHAEEETPGWAQCEKLLAPIMVFLFRLYDSNNDY